MFAFGDLHIRRSIADEASVDFDVRPIRSGTYGQLARRDGYGSGGGPSERWNYCVRGARFLFDTIRRPIMGSRL